MNYNNLILKKKSISIPDHFDLKQSYDTDLFEIIDARNYLPKHNTKQWNRRDPVNLLGVVYHQSLENYGTANGNATYHINPNHISNDGLPGLSYTFFIEKNGVTILANDIECITYSQGNRRSNENYIGVCFGGNFSAPGYVGPQDPTEEQIFAGTYLWFHLKSIFGFNNKQLYGHYFFGKKGCPGYRITELIEKINITIYDNCKYNLNGSIIDRQRALQDVGYYKGLLDNIWGNQSKLALINFQRDCNITVDGVWGRQTTIIMLSKLHFVEKQKIDEKNR